MAEIEGRLGHLHGCHVIQRAGSQPDPGMLTPVPVRLRPPEGRSRPTHGRLPIRSQPTRPASTTSTPGSAPLVHADRKRE
jgi:hypothetical protein